jgi:hypothetical protein
MCHALSIAYRTAAIKPLLCLSQRNHRQAIQQGPVVIQQQQQRQKPPRPGLAPAHTRLTEAGMQYLLMRALHGAAADPAAQPQIFVLAHAPGMLSVISDEGLQLFPQLWCPGPHSFEALNV